MKTIYSHRGNLTGPDPSRENNPAAIDDAIQLGYGVEIDVRCKDGQLYLGHDTADASIDVSWLLARKHSLLVHVKDVQVIPIIERHGLGNLHLLVHQGDAFTLTSHLCVWMHDLSLPIPRASVLPLMDRSQITSMDKDVLQSCLICTDWPVFAKDYLTKLRNAH